MLKLEKVAKSLEISITLRQQDRFFTKNLLRALAIAVGLHFLAGLIFEVQLFKILGSQSQLASILVDSDISLPHQGPVLSQIEKEESSPRLIKEPKSSQLSLPNIQESPRRWPSFIVEMEGPKTNYFETINQEIYPINLMISQKNHHPQKPISIKISGPLAEKDVIDEDLQGIENPLSSGNCRVVYAIQIEDKSGTIFWYEIREIEGSRDIEAVAQKILKSIRFYPSEDSFVTTGEIEIYFNEGVG